jgi:hypothetical protein
MIEKHGSYENWQAWMKEQGKKGGQTKHQKPYYFARLKDENPELLKEISAKPHNRGLK